MEIEYEEYDPFAVLDVDRDEAIREIKRVYHELNKKISSRSWW
jgi:preprotein translocase subunit Sec63